MGLASICIPGISLVRQEAETNKSPELMLQLACGIHQLTAKRHPASNKVEDEYQD